MDWNWEAIGAIGEVFGAVGVIATLGYLAVQIRQNTSSLRASTFHDTIRDLTACSELLASDADLTRIYHEGLRDFESLEPIEKQRFGAYLLVLCRRTENMVYQTQYGALDSASWEGLRHTMRSALSQPGAAAWWARSRLHFNSGFREYVEREYLGAKSASPKNPAA